MHDQEVHGCYAKKAAYETASSSRAHFLNLARPSVAGMNLANIETETHRALIRWSTPCVVKSDSELGSDKPHPDHCNVEAK